METRSARRRRLSVTLNSDSGVDYISHLPDAVLHHILSLLPIKTIAQIATLSARWRHLWLTLPDLDFSDPDSNSNAADIITGILNARDHKQSNVRLLRFSATVGFTRLNALFRTAVRHQIQELDVEICTRDHFNLPRCVIASDSLRIFSLRSSRLGFHLPPSSVMSGGFRLLNSLSLARVQLDRCSVLDLFTQSSFPLLTKLNLERCYMLTALRVHCPALQDFRLEECLELGYLDVFGAKLVRLRICGCFDPRTPSCLKIVAPNLRSLVWIDNGVTDEVCLDDFGSLNEASLGLCSANFPTKAKLHTLSVLLSGISRANSLTFESSFVNVVSSNNNYFACNLPTFNNVNSLELQTVFKKHNAPGIANIFRNCPILHTLTIKIVDRSTDRRKDWRRDKRERIMSEEDKQFWETQKEPLKWFLVHLKVVKIEGFMECLDEVIRLVQFLVKFGISLQELSIFRTKSNHRSDSSRRRLVKSQITGFPRASSDLKFQYC